MGILRKIVIIVIVITLIVTSFVAYVYLNYSTKIACTGEKGVPIYTAPVQGTTHSSFVTRIFFQLFSNTTCAGWGRIGSTYSTTANYTAVGTFSGATATLNEAYYNMTCTYIR